MSTFYSVHLRVEGETNLQRVIKLAQDGIRLVSTTTLRGKKDITRHKRNTMVDQAKETVVELLKHGPMKYPHFHILMDKDFNREVINRALRNLLSESLICAQAGMIVLKTQSSKIKSLTS